MPLVELASTHLRSWRVTNLCDQSEAVSLDNLIDQCCKECSWDIDENRNSSISIESVSSKEYGSHNPSSKVTSKVRWDSNIGKTPDHGGVSQTDDERCRCCWHKRIGWVKCSPDDDTLADVRTRSQVSRGCHVCRLQCSCQQKIQWRTSIHNWSQWLQGKRKGWILALPKN